MLKHSSTRHIDSSWPHHYTFGDIVGHSGYRVTTVLRSLVDVAASGADEDQLAVRSHESVAGGHLTARQLRARAEEIDLKAALHVERALQHLPTA
jgi:hypothetical protein